MFNSKRIGYLVAAIAILPSFLFCQVGGSVNNPGVSASTIAYMTPCQVFNSGYQYNSLFHQSGSTYQMGGNGTGNLLPFWVCATHTFTEISIIVTTGGSSGCLLRMGIYNSTSATMLPGTVLLDAGTVACTAAATAAITISQTLTPGLYWLAVVEQGSPATAPTIDAPYASTPGVFGTTVADYNRGSYYQTGWTSTLPTWSYVGVTGGAPEIYLKAQ